jgi:hypothetical protein
MNELASIGRLERVPLRTVWNHEAYDFTKWLQNNVDVLNEALNITLVNVEREQAAGSFSIDLVAEDDNGGKVIIENQLEKSNHDHLGKLITYLTALNARAAIWIVADPRPEHVAAISWLNDSSSAAFYLVKLEAVQIGTSLPAPLLTKIVGPSEEKSEVAVANKEFAERFNLRKHWWQKLLDQPDAKRLFGRISPGTDTWLSATSGVPGLTFSFVVVQDECGARLYISRGQGSQSENKSVYDQISAHKDEIEQAFGGPLKWERLDNQQASRIEFRLTGGYRSPEEDWPRIQTDCVQAMNRLERALRPFINELKIKG